MSALGSLSGAKTIYTDETKKYDRNEELSGTKTSTISDIIVDRVYTVTDKLDEEIGKINHRIDDEVYNLRNNRFTNTYFRFSSYDIYVQTETSEEFSNMMMYSLMRFKMRDVLRKYCGPSQNLDELPINRRATVLLEFSKPSASNVSLNASRFYGWLYTEDRFYPTGMVDIHDIVIPYSEFISALYKDYADLYNILRSETNLYYRFKYRKLAKAINEMASFTVEIAH